MPQETVAMPDPVTIVIPALNLWERTRECLESLRRFTPGRYFRVVLADDGSTDATPTEAPILGAALFPDRFACVRLETNSGFAVACNAGAAGAASDYLLFLNNDTILTDNWLPPLLAEFKADPKLGALSPLLLFPDTGRLQHAGIGFDLDLRATHLYFLFPGTHPVLGVRRRLQAISGSAFMLPRRLFEGLGGFYPGYVNGSEDLDLCAAIRSGGLSVSCCPDSRIVHVTSATPGRFDHIPDNTRLLNTRCAGCFRPDLHELARRDGFGTALNEWLRPHLRLPATQEAALDASQAKADPLDALSVLAVEPLWENGYRLAVTGLAAAGAAREAFDTAALWAHFFPSLESLARRLALAGAVADEQEQETARTELLVAKAAVAAPQALRARALENMAVFRRAGQDEVAALYQAWLDARGLGGPAEEA